MRKKLSFLLVLAVSFSIFASFANASRPGTCAGQCNLGQGTSYGALPCYCDKICTENGDCCDDYQSACSSASGHQDNFNPPPEDAADTAQSPPMCPGIPSNGIHVGLTYSADLGDVQKVSSILSDFTLTKSQAQNANVVLRIDNQHEITGNCVYKDVTYQICNSNGIDWLDEGPHNVALYYKNNNCDIATKDFTLCQNKCNIGGKKCEGNRILECKWNGACNVWQESQTCSGATPQCSDSQCVASTSNPGNPSIPACSALPSCTSSTSDCSRQCTENGNTITKNCASFDSGATYSWKSSDDITCNAQSVQCKPITFPLGCTSVTGGHNPPTAKCYTTKSTPGWLWNDETSQIPQENCNNQIDDNCNGQVNEGCGPAADCLPHTQTTHVGEEVTITSTLSSSNSISWTNPENNLQTYAINGVNSPVLRLKFPTPGTKIIQGLIFGAKFAQCTVEVLPSTPNPSSCAGKCGTYQSSSSCQCDVGCISYGDCCSDYNSVCNAQNTQFDNCPSIISVNKPCSSLQSQCAQTCDLTGTAVSYVCSSVGDPNVAGNWQWRTTSDFASRCSAASKCTTFAFPGTCTAMIGGNPATNTGKCYSLGGKTVSTDNANLPKWRYDSEKVCKDSIVRQQGNGGCGTVGENSCGDSSFTSVQSCGSQGQPCCTNNQCNSGLTCQNGVCNPGTPTTATTTNPTYLLQTDGTTVNGITTLVAGQNKLRIILTGGKSGDKLSIKEKRNNVDVLFTENGVQTYEYTLCIIPQSNAPIPYTLCAPDFITPTSNDIGDWLADVYINGEKKGTVNFKVVAPTSTGGGTTGGTGPSSGATKQQLLDYINSHCN